MSFLKQLGEFSGSKVTIAGATFLLTLAKVDVVTNYVSEVCSTIYMPLDNASYHKKKTTLAEIEKNLPNIQLYFLPEYSPDLNLAELIWHSAKEYISHRLFKSVDELKNLLDRLLNQGDLIIKWGRKIKNKGNAAIAN